MQDQNELLSLKLGGLGWTDWLETVSPIATDRGFLEELGPDHAALFIEDGDTLLVTFESFPGLPMLSDAGAPLGWDIHEATGWSHLAVVAREDTWFRDANVYAFFDQLIDDGFFDEFDRVLFFGAGPCGYAAGAFSVAAPGAHVMMLQPQATLDPRSTEWETRFTEQRMRDFTGRYDYAPEMIEAARRAYVLYDPRERLDAMHAALFRRSNTERFRLPFMGADLLHDLVDLDLLEPLLLAMADETLDAAAFARLYRARRGHAPYLRKLLQRLESDGRPRFVEMLCRNVVSRMNAPRFRRKLEALRRARAAAEAEAEAELEAEMEAEAEMPRTSEAS